MRNFGWCIAAFVLAGCPHKDAVTGNGEALVPPGTRDTLIVLINFAELGGKLYGGTSSRRCIRLVRFPPRVLPAQSMDRRFAATCTVNCRELSTVRRNLGRSESSYA